MTHDDRFWRQNRSGCLALSAVIIPLGDAEDGEDK
jgi:hypothetical protein